MTCALLMLLTFVGACLCLWPVPWWRVERGLVPYFVFWGAVWVCVLLWFDGVRARYKESLEDPRNQRAGLEYIYISIAREEARDELYCREVIWGKVDSTPKEVRAYCQAWLDERESTGGPYPIYCSEWVRLDGVPEIVKARCRESFPPPSLTPKGDTEGPPQDPP